VRLRDWHAKLGERRRRVNGHRRRCARDEIDRGDRAARLGQPNRTRRRPRTQDRLPDPNVCRPRAALAAVLVGIAWVGGGVRAGFVPTVVDLLTPLELLVPIVAVAFGYRAILGDRRRGELDVLDTYPIAPRELVLGVYVGRAVGLLGTVVVPLLLVGGAVFVGREEPFSRYASHAGADSPILFARFVALTALFALSILAVALAISALVSGTRSALALSVVALVVLLVGLDLALVYGFTNGYLADSSLVHALAVSPPQRVSRTRLRERRRNGVGDRAADGVARGQPAGPCELDGRLARRRDLGDTTVVFAREIDSVESFPITSATLVVPASRPRVRSDRRRTRPGMRPRRRDRKIRLSTRPSRPRPRYRRRT